MPTLKVGDRVLVNKLSYDLHDVHRGDIVVFEAEPNLEWHRRRHRRPREARDRAARRDRHRSARPTASASTGELLDESYLPKGTITTMPTELPYITNATARRCSCATRDSPEGGCTVPAGKIFVMGDNRANSSGRTRQRADQGVEHRRPRVPAHLAAGTHRLHVVAVRSPCTACDRDARCVSVNSPTVATMRATWSE